MQVCQKYTFLHFRMGNIYLLCKVFKANLFKRAIALFFLTNGDPLSSVQSV